MTQNIPAQKKHSQKDYGYQSMAKVLEALDYGIVLLDPDLGILYTNDWFKHHCSQLPYNFLTKNFFDIFPGMANSQLD